MITTNNYWNTHEPAHWYLLQATSIEVYLIQIRDYGLAPHNPTENCELRIFNSLHETMLPYRRTLFKKQVGAAPHTVAITTV
jgi:hypothetical protein